MKRLHSIVRRLGIVFHGQKIWISELTGIFFITFLSLLFLSISMQILTNEHHIYNLTRKISAGKSAAIIRNNFLEELRERTAITSLLRLIARKKLTQKTLLELSDIVYTNSTQYGYDPLLLLAVIEVESVFETNALGKYRSGSLSGALGLMQLKYATAQEVASQLSMDSLTEADLFKPEINVVLGVAYLTTMISRFRSFKLGLLAYNQGPGVIKKKLSENEPLSVDYYNKVLRSYYGLKKKSLYEAALHEQ